MVEAGVLHSQSGIGASLSRPVRVLGKYPVGKYPVGKYPQPVVTKG